MSIQGLKMQGLIYNADENYNSIPGLKFWLDSRYRVTLTDGKLSAIGDLSPTGTVLSIKRAVNHAYYDGSIINFNSSLGGVGQLTATNSSDYKFMSDGSAFGVYAIIKLTLSDFTSSSPLFNTFTNTGGTGIRITYVAAGNGRLFTDIQSGGSVLFTNYLSNVGLVEPGGVWLIHKFLFKGPGIASNVHVKFGAYTNVSTNAATTFPTNNPDGIRMFGNPNAGKDLKTGLTLIYNWAGKTSAEIDALDAKVMSFLNDDLTIFSTL